MKTDLQTLVAELLTKYPTLRDDDRSLCCNTWIRELETRDIDFEDINARDFLTLYKNKALTNSDTITRLRRKLQEEHPSLRGFRYNERQNRITDVQMELGYATKRK